MSSLRGFDSNWYVPDDTDAEAPGDPLDVVRCTVCDYPCLACWVDAAGRCPRCHQGAAQEAHRACVARAQVPGGLVACDHCGLATAAQYCERTEIDDGAGLHEVLWHCRGCLHEMELRGDEGRAA